MNKVPEPNRERTKNTGIFAVFGKGFAIVQTGRLQLSGYLALP
jgi:hypothetical protein